MGRGASKLNRVATSWISCHPSIQPLSLENEGKQLTDSYRGATAKHTATVQGRQDGPTKSGKGEKEEKKREEGSNKKSKGEKRDREDEP